MLYNELVEDHFNRPRNPAAGPCEQMLCGQAGSVERGTWLEFQLSMDDDQIVAARFRAYGCPHAIALGSWLTEHLPGRTLTADLVLDRHAITRVLGLPVDKLRVVLVAEDALRACATAMGAGRGH